MYQLRRAGDREHFKQRDTQNPGAWRVWHVRELQEQCGWSLGN